MCEKVGFRATVSNCTKVPALFAGMQNRQCWCGKHISQFLCGKTKHPEAHKIKSQAAVTDEWKQEVDRLQAGHVNMSVFHKLAALVGPPAFGFSSHRPIQAWFCCLRVDSPLPAERPQGDGRQCSRQTFKAEQRRRLWPRRRPCGDLSMVGCP